jgi:putative membrane protein
VFVSALFAFLHFASIFGIVSIVFFQWLTMSKAPTLIEARRIQRSDRWYGILAGVLIVVGFLRVYFFEKGAAYYFSNPFFHLKLTLFIVMGLLSIYPTIKFIGWGKETRLGKPPAVPDGQFIALSRILLLELLTVFAIALCASLMARGLTI